MNKKKINYQKFKNFTSINLKKKIELYCHYDNVKNPLMSEFFFTCKQNNFFISKIKLNLFNSKINNILKKNLMAGPTILISSTESDFFKMYSLINKFVFIYELSWFFKNKILNPLYIKSLIKNKHNLLSFKTFPFLIKFFLLTFISIVTKPLLFIFNCIKKLCLR